MPVIISCRTFRLGQVYKYVGKWLRGCDVPENIMALEKIPAALLIGLAINISVTKAPIPPTPKNERRMEDGVPTGIKWSIWIQKASDLAAPQSHEMTSIEAGYLAHTITKLCIVVGEPQSQMELCHSCYRTANIQTASNSPQPQRSQRPWWCWVVRSGIGPFARWEDISHTASPFSKTTSSSPRGPIVSFGTQPIPDLSS